MSPTPAVPQADLVSAPPKDIPPVMLVVALAAAMLMVVAAPPRLSVVALALNTLAVVEVVVNTPPFMAKLPAMVIALPL